MFSDIYRNSTEKNGKYVKELSQNWKQNWKTPTGSFLLLFMFSPIVEKWLIVFRAYCIISAYTQDCELKFTR